MGLGIGRMWAMFRRRRLDGELDTELRAHLEMATEDHRRRGMSEIEAREAALRDFGGVTQVRETVREREGLLWAENLRRDVLYAMRQMKKSPGFAAVVVLTLALGIGATTAMFTVVYSTLMRALPYPDAEKILALHDARIQGVSTGGLMGAPRFFDVKARNRSFESLGFFFFDHPTLIAGRQLPVAVEAVGTNGEFWNVAGVRPLLGRVYGSQDDEPNAPETAVLSYSGWQKIFGGDRSVIREQIRLDGRAVTIVGVMPAEFNMPSGVDLWHDAQFAAADWKSYRGEGARFINVFGRLRPGVTLETAQADLDRIGEQLRAEYPHTDGLWRFTSQTLRESRYGTMRPALLALVVAAALLLLIACINVANLLLSRATARQREVALRRALGASAGRIAMQYLTESVVLGLAGGGAGVAAAFVLIRGVAAKLPGKLGVPGTVEMNWPVVLVALVIALGTGIAFGVAPVLESRRVELNTTMKQGEARVGGSGHKLRSALVSVQVGLSLILLVGAALMAKSLWHLLTNPLGFVPEHVLTVSVKVPWDTKDAGIRNFFGEVQRRLENLPGVQAVGQMDALPTVDWHLRSNFDADWLPRMGNQPAINAEDRNVEGNFLGAMGVPLLAGRALTAEDSREKNIPVMVNQELVQEYLPGGNPLGRHLLVNNTPHEIVGVIANLRGTAGAIASPPGPEVYWPADGNGGVAGRYFVVRSQRDPEQLVSAIRKQVEAVDPQRAVGDVATMDELLNHAVAQPRLHVTVVAALAGIALLLACVGIYGVVAYFVAQRTQEIGVRMALGATRGKIAALFVKRALVTAAIGLGGGTCASLALTQLLRSQLYGVQPNDPAMYGAAIAALLIPVAIATLRPALVAASVNPVEALRE
ncbi:MAG TPA: ABC transporter permease [Acidobacteriaceae bacterium]|nr:ABC transporter permease [Acidobacteriaceae bacterium]